MKIFCSDAEFLPCFGFCSPNSVSIFGQAPLFPDMPSRLGGALTNEEYCARHMLI